MNRLIQTLLSKNFFTTNFSTSSPKDQDHDHHRHWRTAKYSDCQTRSVFFFQWRIINIIPNTK